MVPDGTGPRRGFRNGYCGDEPREFYHLDDVDSDDAETVFRIRSVANHHCMTVDGTTIVQRECADDDPNQQFVLTRVG